MKVVGGAVVPQPRGVPRRATAGLAVFVSLVFVMSACAGGTILPSATPPDATSPVISPPRPAPTPTATPTVAATPGPTPKEDLSACDRFGVEQCVKNAIAQIDQNKMWDHLRALTAVGSRDPRHAGHTKAVAYIREQLGAVLHVKIETHRTTFQGIPLENIFAIIDPRGLEPPKDGWVLIAAHYDSISNRSPGWNPSRDPAPGADDNATGTAALLEYARILGASNASRLRSRIVLGFFDGEELFYKGSAAYVQSLPKPYPYKAAINIDMVGFNPIADRLDLLWHTSASAALRDRVIAVNQRYAIGVSPLNAQAAPDGNTIMDGTPFGLAGIPSVALTQRYGEIDANHPGNFTFHTVNDTPDKITNPRLWLKAAKLTLAVALELATAP